MVKKDTSYQETFSGLGQSWDVSKELFQRIKEFTCHMYAANSSTVEVNQARYQLFCTKRGEVESSQLPPCRDCLFLNVERANYQAAIWKSSLQSNPVVPSPTEHGWKEDEGKLALYWMRSPPAPDVVLELLTCKCVRSCKMPSCTCLSNGLAYTDMCKLQTCSNQKLQDDPEPDFELEESEDERDEQFK